MYYIMPSDAAINDFVPFPSRSHSPTRYWGQNVLSTQRTCGFDWDGPSFAEHVHWRVSMTWPVVAGFGKVIEDDDAG